MPGSNVVRRFCWPAGLLILLLAGWPAVAEVASIKSYAIVRDDATLVVGNQKVWLFGIFIPQTGRICEDRIRPAQCGTRAAQALRLKIQGFIECQPKVKFRDGTLGAICYADARSMLDPPVDLGAWLIQEGLAVAGRDAPFEYHTYERVARSQKRGLWGFQVDQIR